MNQLEFLPAGSKVFVDANVFLYAIFDHPRYRQVCEAFLSRIGDDISAFTSTVVLNEVIHKSVLVEVASKYNLREVDVLSSIKQNPSLLTHLSKYKRVCDLLMSYSGLDILEYQAAHIRKLPSVIDTGFLLSDAAHILLCQENNILNIATNDQDFEHANLKVWTPQSV